MTKFLYRFFCVLFCLLFLMTLCGELSGELASLPASILLCCIWGTGAKACYALSEKGTIKALVRSNKNEQN